MLAVYVFLLVLILFVILGTIVSSLLQRAIEAEDREAEHVALAALYQQ